LWDAAITSQSQHILVAAQQAVVPQLLALLDQEIAEAAAPQEERARPECFAE